MIRAALRAGLVAGTITLLSACTTAVVKEQDSTARELLYETRLARLQSTPSWSLEGRLAVSDDKDGGSGTLRWMEQGSATRMDFHGALGRGAWRLQAGQGRAELELADGSHFTAVSAEELVRRQLGWAIPVDALAWWVRGLAIPGEAGIRTLDEEGRLNTLAQREWTVEYSRYKDIDGLQLPGRITARQDDRTVKLAIRTWTLEGALDGND